MFLSAEQAAARVTLHLGDVVSSAGVRGDGAAAGIRVGPPWRFDLTGLVRAGENLIEVLVYNTLASHYLTVPTRYRGSTVSGLLGPVTIRETGPWSCVEARSGSCREHDEGGSSVLSSPPRILVDGSPRRH